MLKRIFPPANELTVFVMTVTVLSMFIYMDGWADKAVVYHFEIIEKQLYEIHQAKGIKDTIFGYASLIFTPVFLFIIIFGPLLLPFNKKDLRALCATIILIDASIIAYGNMGLAKESPSAINSLMAFYSGIWIIYILVVLRMREVNYLMSAEQAKAIPACIAACVSTIAVFVAIKVFSVNWVKAYSIGSILTSILFTLGWKFYFENEKSKNVTEGLRSEQL